MEEKFIGCLLGVAVGDALGQPIEAFPLERLRKEFGEIRDFMDGDSRFALPLSAGQWTDDTQLTLDVARSIVRCGKVDPEDIAREFLADHEAVGIRFSGFTIKNSLIRLKRGIPWDKSAIEDEEAQGNGSAMRVAPVGLLHYRTLNQLPEAARLAGIITHRHPETIAGSLAVAYLVARAAAGTLNLATAIDDTVALIRPCKVAENLRIAQRLLREDHTTAEALLEIGTTGWIVHTVAAAVYCFLKTPTDFERSVIDAVMGGNDADTTAAITGAVSGAYNGEDSIPVRWKTNVESADEIRALAQALWKVQA